MKPPEQLKPLNGETAETVEPANGKKHGHKAKKLSARAPRSGEERENPLKHGLRRDPCQSPQKHGRVKHYPKRSGTSAGGGPDHRASRDNRTVREEEEATWAE